MAKTNVRSFRFDDDIMAIIEAFDGNNFSEKFDNIVKYCFIKVPEAKAKLDDLEKQIDEKKKELIELTDLSLKVNAFKCNIISLGQNISNIHYEAKGIYEKMKKAREKCNT